jgi:double-strand break repair protein AddB
METAEHPCPPGLENAHGHHMAVVRCFAGVKSHEPIFTGEADEKLNAILEVFAAQKDKGFGVTYLDYLSLLDRALAADKARQQVGIHPHAMIWGPLEARVQGADVVILGGLNEGVWPEQPPSDPWLNRNMRREVGLLLPERQIGLAAHDFQQAACAGEVVLTRSAQTDGAETVPSRWLSRLTNLLAGLQATGGDVALECLLARGQRFIDFVRATDQPKERCDPAPRPAPRPPLAKRPRDYAVTEIKRLIQDPYAIYARRILQLAPLDPLIPEMDARRKGIVFHAVLEQFYDPKVEFEDLQAAQEKLSEITRQIFDREVPELATQVLWRSQLLANANWLFEEEVKRREVGEPIGTEVKGRYSLPQSTFVLRGKADRIDRLNDGRLVIYDYKTGAPPSKKDILLFDRQLVLEAVMAEAGAFKGIPPTPVAHVVHLGVGRRPSERITELIDENDTVTIPSKLASLLAAYLEPKNGFMSRRAMEAVRFGGDYDHLARFGEWDSSQDALSEDVG